MKTLNSISGGKSSAYMAVNYPADINIFSLVRIDNPAHLWMKGKDEKTRQLISDRLGYEFIGTAEFDTIIYTILDLEQMLGKEIIFVSGQSFDELIIDRKGFLPSYSRRFCTTEFKITPILDYLYDNEQLPLIHQIGYRYGEESRQATLMDRQSSDGYEYQYKRLDLKPNSRYYNRDYVKYRKTSFPLIDNRVGPLQVNDFWKDKKVRFAPYNNCLFCVNRSPLFLSHIAKISGVEFYKGIYLEQLALTESKKNNKKHIPQFRHEDSLLNIANKKDLFSLDSADFNECDSGYCGL